jgi:hypothetical protein
MFFPWLAAKAKVQEKLAMDYEGLIELINKIEDVCNKVNMKGGKNAGPKSESSKSSSLHWWMKCVPT